MWIKQLFLGFFGLCAGGMTAAGVFAFLAMIGILPRLIGKTGTKRQTRLYETMMILGGSLGNAADLFPVPLPAGKPAQRRRRDFCRVPGDVSGGNAEGAAGHEPAHPLGSGISLCGFVHRHRKNAGISVLFLSADRRMKEVNRWKLIKRSIRNI